MKRTLHILLFLMCFGTVLSQGDEIYTITETAAEFPGGMNTMMKFLQENIRYPKAARDLPVGGKVFLKFVVDETGKVGSVEVLKSAGMKEMDEEALRVVNMMPLWKPAQMSGRNVKCYFNLPIGFVLDSPYFIYNAFNKNEHYQAAWLAVQKGELDDALALYQKDVGDLAAWFNMGVIYYMKNNKTESRKYFENVKTNGGPNDILAVLSTRFLSNNF